MQIEAIYDSGTLLLPAIRQKLQVIIPDDEIVHEYVGNRWPQVPPTNPREPGLCRFS